ncbi:MAG: ABC transporter permease, partial [candidate division KSB1 bacterium]|nr:ABC transporter permease [candidate division KSB1 bacterium]
MIWTIAKKEFFEKILDSRVTISFLIAMALSIVTAIVVGEDYQGRKKAYDEAVAQAQAELENVKVFSEYQPDVVFPPSPLSIFSKGIELASPMTLNIRPDWVPRYEPAEAGSNPLMRIFEALDIATVLRILFALLVILLTYDAFSGEKETGALRLTMSNPVSKVKLLYGKLIGALMVVTIGVFLTFAIALILAQALYGIAMSSEDYVRVILILATTLLYLAIFAVLGTLASIKFSSSTSLTVLLFVWFVVGILHPDLNTFAVSELGSTPRFADLEPALDEASYSYAADLEKLQAQYGAVLNDKSKQKFFESATNVGNVPVYVIVADADYKILEYLIKQTQLYRKTFDTAEKEWQL